jgi:hypothetical protein
MLWHRERVNIPEGLNVLNKLNEGSERMVFHFGHSSWEFTENVPEADPYLTFLTHLTYLTNAGATR